MAFYLLQVAQWFDNNGNPLSGGLISTFQGGSVLAQSTFTDSTGTTQNANPITLDSAGRAQIWLSANNYKFVVKTSAGVTLQTIDNFNPAQIANTVTSLIDTGALTMQQPTAATALANQNSNILTLQGNYWTGAVSAVDQWQLQVVLGAGANPTTTLQISHSGSSGVATVSWPSMTFGNLAITGNETIAGTLAVIGATTLNGGTLNGTYAGNPLLSGDLALSTGKVIKWNSDTGLSRDAAGVIDVGNGIQGDISGTAKAAAFISPSFRSNSANIASTGIVRIASTDFIAFRNNANGADLAIAKTGAVSGSTPADTLSIAAFGGLFMAGVIQGAALQGAGSGNSVTLLNSQDTLGNVTGNGTDQTLYTFTIPANMVQAGKGFRVRAIFQSNNAVAVTYKIIVGTTTLSTVPNSSASEFDEFSLELFNNAGVQNAQTGIVRVVVGTVSAVASTASAENFANAIAVKITANEANPNTVTPRKWFVELIQ
jgi:hypothetical protein